FVQQLRQRLHTQGLTPHERLLFGALRHEPTASIPISLFFANGYGPGSSGIPREPNVWFRLSGADSVINAFGPALTVRQLQSAYEVMVHELSHAVDYLNGVEGYLDGVNGHRRVYSELRANLWAN